jgi:outer membrane protein assembly factor BamB
MEIRRMNCRLLSATLLVAALLHAPGVLWAADWLQWRGPLGTGQSNEKNVPLTWSKTENVKWKAPLDGPGNSSPIVVGQKVFITHAPARSDLRGIQCYDRNTGELLWKHHISYAEPELTHSTNPFCSPSPVSDGQRVVAWYGSPGIYCYDLDGKILWQKKLGKLEHIWGFGGSPVIYDNLVILNFGPGLNAFVAAFDKQTGREVWRKEFPGQKSQKVDEYRGSWSTPVVFQDGSRTVLLLSLPGALWAVDPKTGEEVWSCRGLGALVYTSPLIDGDVVIAMSGYGGPALAVRGGGKGDVTETHRLWHHETPKPPQRVGSGVVAKNHVFILNEPGAAWCLDSRTGEKKWEQRVGRNRSWCSMVHVDGRLYISNKAGATIVLEPSTESCQVLAENELGEQIEASPAFSNSQIFIRTHQNLYCVEAKL